MLYDFLFLTVIDFVAVDLALHEEEVDVDGVETRQNSTPALGCT
jgi:hypothetical protein